MKYKLVIFDLDGTLVDTIGDLGAAANEALRAHGLPPHTPDEYRGMVGNGVRKLVKRAMPEPLRGDERLLDALLEVFLDYYLQHIDDRSQPYPGIPELLADLHGRDVRLAVASNKFQAGTERLIGRMFPQIPFAAVCGGLPERALKPDPAVVRDIWACTGLQAEHTVMVGDSGTDIATAAAAGIPSVAVAWGFRPKEALTDAGFLAESVAQLRSILLSE